MSAYHTIRIATVSFALAALVGFAAPAGAAITANALTNNAITANALTNNALTNNGLSPTALAPATDQLDELNGVVVEGVALPAAPVR